MRLTLVTETYAPQVNGVSRTLGQLVRVMRAAGDEVQVVHPDYGHPAESVDVLAACQAMPFYPELMLPLPPFGRIGRAIDRFAPDLVHIATEATLGLASLLHARRRRMKVVSSFHTNFDLYTAHYRVGWLNSIVWSYLRWFHNATLETYAPSRASIQSLSARGLAHLALWPRGVDCHLFSPARLGRNTVREALGFRPDQVVVGHVSRIAPEKNVGYLAEALHRLIQRCGDMVRVLIVGDGPARSMLEQRLGSAARCVGYKTDADLADHYAASDLFAFASLTETFGNVILEAMASGLPVVAIRAGGPGETVREGETGLLVEPSDPPECMADKLSVLVRNSALRRTFSLRAREYAESQSWDAIMSQLRERYQHWIARSL